MPPGSGGATAFRDLGPSGPQPRSKESQAAQPLEVFGRIDCLIAFILVHCTFAHNVSVGVKGVYGEIRWSLLVNSPMP